MLAKVYETKFSEKEKTINFALKMRYLDIFRLTL